MQRQFYIERCLRQIYGGYVNDDANITVNLVNSYLNDAVAIAAKQNYKDNVALEGIGFVNNSFYTTFKGIAVTKDENFIWKLSLPQIPLGIGASEGIQTLKFKNSASQVSLPCIPLTANQATFFQTMRPIPNKVLYKSESGFIYAISTIILSQYTATVTMISGGDSTDLTSTINVPDDYFPVIVEYIKAQLTYSRMQPVDAANDGLDAVKTT